MGYTHYWERPKTLAVEKFNAAVEDCRKLCEALGIPLGDSEGREEPEFSTEAVCFNGHVESGSYSRQAGLLWPADKAQSVAAVGETVCVGGWCAGPEVAKRCVDDDGDGSYETFAVEQNYEPCPGQEPHLGLWFSFCKTNFRPYDLCVQGCLIVFKERFGAVFQVTSDGTDEQWNEARDACQVVLGYGLDFQLG